ncbi:1999_t:CDS:2 [Cetraspora pellucida]|uniref:1999_t:CDS:1 n=1 Tax=Cetraspora pellucida TaxID=1433469 RepID=A0A9N9HKW0_9GLOM|nr:1999_t:CDS:2 [Cetraspora pellucida]
MLEIFDTSDESNGNDKITDESNSDDESTDEIYDKDTSDEITDDIYNNDVVDNDEEITDKINDYDSTDDEINDKTLKTGTNFDDLKCFEEFNESGNFDDLDCLDEDEEKIFNAFKTADKIISTLSIKSEEQDLNEMRKSGDIKTIDLTEELNLLNIYTDSQNQNLIINF